MVQAMVETHTQDLGSDQEAEIGMDLIQGKGKPLNLLSESICRMLILRKGEDALYFYMEFPEWARLLQRVGSAALLTSSALMIDFLS